MKLWKPVWIRACVCEMKKTDNKILIVLTIIHFEKEYNIFLLFCLRQEFTISHLQVPVCNIQ